METDLILTLVSVGLGLIATVAGGFWLKAKGKLSDIKTLAKETADLVTVAVNAIDDNKITPEEVAQIKKEAVEVKAAWRKLIGRV